VAERFRHLSRRGVDIPMPRPLRPLQILVDTKSVQDGIIRKHICLSHLRIRAERILAFVVTWLLP
jgi:hypothetical protein